MGEVRERENRRNFSVGGRGRFQKRGRKERGPYLKEPPLWKGTNQVGGEDADDREKAGRRGLSARAIASPKNGLGGREPSNAGRTQKAPSSK